MNKTNPPISDKDTARSLVKDYMSNMTDEQKKNEGHEICKEIKKILSEKIPETLIVYIPLLDEVDIRSVTEEYVSLSEKKSSLLRKMQK